MVMYQTSKTAVNKPDFDTGAAECLQHPLDGQLIFVYICTHSLCHLSLIRVQTTRKKRALSTSSINCPRSVKKPWERRSCRCDMQQAEKLLATQRVPGTIRLFERKDYYSAHGEDALYGVFYRSGSVLKSPMSTYYFLLRMIVADNVYHTKTVIKYWKSKSSKNSDLPSCTLSKAVAINFLRESLTSRQLRIEIWAPNSSSSSSKSSASWEIERAASPGNLQDVEDLLFASTNILESPMCLAITFRMKEGIKHVGIAYADSVEHKIGVSEFVETDIFSNTEVRDCFNPFAVHTLVDK